MSGRASSAKLPPAAPEIRQLSHLLPALWRSVTRATNAYRDMPALESQVSILRQVVDNGMASPAQLADGLHLARSTVSNLLRDLEADGLVQRRPSTTDGRAVVVEATAHGRAVLANFRRGRANVLQQAVASLTPADQLLVVRALPALEKLLNQLDDLAEAAPTDQENTQRLVDVGAGD